MLVGFDIEHRDMRGRPSHRLLVTLLGLHVSFSSRIHNVPADSEMAGFLEETG